MNLWFLLFIGLAPVAFMLYLIYVNDKYEREGLGRVLTVFFISFLTVIPAIILEKLFWREPTDFISLAVLCFVIIGGSEEIAKYVFLRVLAVNHRSFNEVYDGIVYGVAASLGFATVENVLYILGSAMGEGGTAGAGLMTAIMRALTSIPGHALWGVMMGYYIGLAKFTPNPAQKRMLVYKGVGLAIFWHGLYDLFALGSSAFPAYAGLSIIGLLVTVVLTWVAAFRLIHRAQEQSCFKRPHPLLNPVAAFNLRWKYCTRCGRPAPGNLRFCMACGQPFPGTPVEPGVT